MNMKNKVKISERGWAGHFCLADKCAFHRNTLIEVVSSKVVSSNKKQLALPAIVVSSVGKMINSQYQLEEIGCDRYYETYVWYASDNNKWRDADISLGAIEELSPDYPSNDKNALWDELPANDFHDKVVARYVEKLKNGESI